MKQSEIHCNCSPGTVAKLLLTASGKQGGAVLFAPPRKAVAFLTTPTVCQEHGTGISLPEARFFRLFPKNPTPFPRNSTKKFDSRKKTCYNKNGCRSMTVAVDFFMEIHCGGDRLSPASIHNDLWIMEKESGNERCSNTGIIRKDWIFL